MAWNENDIKRLAKKNKIRGFKLQGGANFTPGNKITPEQKRSAQKDWMELNLQYWCNNRSVTLVKEHVFDVPKQLHGQEIPRRQWRFDFCIPAFMVAIEYEGIFAVKSGHTTLKGYTSDANKYNRAQQLGWKVLRFTAANYKETIKELDACIS